jgi:hypothetical protein
VRDVGPSDGLQVTIELPAAAPDDEPADKGLLTTS